MDGRARHGASNGCFREEEERDGKAGERSGRKTYARGGRMDTWDACRCKCMANLAVVHVRAVFVPVKPETNHAYPQSWTCHHKKRGSVRLFDAVTKIP